MEGFLSKAYYGNTITEWAISIGIVVAALIVGKVLYWLTKNVLRQLTARTKTRLDDILIDMVEEPVIFAVMVAGIWLGLRRLTLPERAVELADQALEVLITLAVTWLVARLVDSLIREYLIPLAEKSETDLDDQIMPIFRKGAKLGVWALGLVVALNNAGQDVGALIAGLGIGGLALAMAAKDTVANIFGGFTIFSDRPFGLNQRVRVAGFDGTIKEIGIRSTRLQTLDGTMVTIPNSKFADSAVENVSLEPSRKVPVSLGLTYDTSPGQMERAMAILREIASENPSVEDEAKVGFNAFGDSAMNVLFIYYIKKEEDILATQSAINLAILRRFTAEGLELAFPTQTVYTKAVAG